MPAEVLPVDLGEGIAAGFTRRHGGVSTGPWAGLDLGLHVGDDVEAVAANRASVADLFGAPVVFARQVHGIATEVVTAAAVDGVDLLRTDLAADAGCDALVTIGTAHALGVLVADCVPVLLADPAARVVGTAHAGREGLLAGVVQRALAVMAARGADVTRVRAALGPAAGGCCYEVPQAMQDAAVDALPAVRSRTTWGTPSLDLRAGVRAVLEAAGVASVVLVGGCSIEDDDVFSHRRATKQGTPTGRCAGVVRLLA